MSPLRRRQAPLTPEEIPVLAAHERYENYHKQNGTPDRVTPRQRSRIRHKANHQLLEAGIRREQAAADRAKTR